jgi:thiamine-phosphate pyrophosphorylase
MPSGCGASGLVAVARTAPMPEDARRLCGPETIIGLSAASEAEIAAAAALPPATSMPSGCGASGLVAVARTAPMPR